jgi:hypothetical protein
MSEKIPCSYFMRLALFRYLIEMAKESSNEQHMPEYWFCNHHTVEDLSGKLRNLLKEFGFESLFSHIDNWLLYDYFKDSGLRFESSGVSEDHNEFKVVFGSKDWREKEKEIEAQEEKYFPEAEERERFHNLAKALSCFRVENCPEREAHAWNT